MSKYFLFSSSDKIPLGERCRIVWRRVHSQIVELNLFDTQTARNDPHELTTSKISTRVYMVLTCLSVLILTIYTAANIQTETIVVANPSQKIFTDLYTKYSSTLECPCTRIATPYNNFVSLSPQYHPVCSSLFISSAWINSISTSNWPNDLFDGRDFRVVGEGFFNALGALCSFTKVTVSNAWYIFKQSSFITEQSLTEQQVIVRIRATLTQFESNTIGELKRALTIIQFQTRNLFSIGSQNYFLGGQELTNSTKPIEFYTYPSNWSDCSCAISDECQYPVGFYYLNASNPGNWVTSTYDISQIFTGCFIIQSVFQSSLQCFFNQTCLNAIQSEIVSDNSINITVLQVNSTRFLPETLISELIDALMVEQWGELVNYSQYYEQCAPKLCTYRITTRNSVSYVIVLLLGLCGGIAVALKITVPLIVRQLRNRCRPNVETNTLTVRPTLANRVRMMVDLIRSKILEFNLFETELSWNDAERRRREIISTRLHLLLLVISVCILIIYTSLTIDTRTITIQSPSQSTFDQLRLNPQYAPTLRCPCQNINIPYQSFISFSFQFHQLCSSHFIDINSTWTNMLNSTVTTEDYPYDDFRLFALPQFRLLASLCSLANDTITEATTHFSMNTLITDRTQSREVIQSKAETVLTQFRLSTMRTFVRTLDFTRNMSQGNGIVAATLSNWYFVAIDRTDFATIWTKPRSYGDQNNCSCVSSSMCSSRATINGSLISGFRVGCYALDSLLQSTLECLYDANCIDIIKSTYHSFNLTINSLDPTVSFSNATVQSLVDTLLIDQWKTNVSYEQYYTTCAPLFCSYSLNSRASFLYIVTAIIAFCGGLNTAFKIIAPILTKTGQFFILYYRQRIQRRINIVLDNE